MVIVFLVLVLAVMVTANWYVWRRLFRDTTSGPGWVRRAGAALVAGGWVMAFGALIAERTGAPFWLQRVLAWPGFLWLALSIYLLLGLLAGEAVRPLLRRLLERRKPAEVPVRQAEPVSVGAPPAPEPEDSGLLVAAPSRRLFVSRVIGGAAAAVAVGTVGVGTYGVLNGPSVKRVTVPLAKLPRAAHGYRIAVVSDIHLGPVLGRGFAQRVVDTINSTQPDLVAVVGDLVDGSVKDLGPAAAPCGSSTPPPTSSPATTSTSRAPSSGSRRYGGSACSRWRTPAPNCPGSTSPASMTSRARTRARAPTSPRRSATATGHARACSSPTSPSRSTTLSSTASTSSSPATPTAASSGPATSSRPGRIRPWRALSGTATPSSTSAGAPVRGARPRGSGPRPTSR